MNAEQFAHWLNGVAADLDATGQVAPGDAMWVLIRRELAKMLDDGAAPQTDAPSWYKEAQRRAEDTAPKADPGRKERWVEVNPTTYRARDLNEPAELRAAQYPSHAASPTCLCQHCQAFRLEHYGHPRAWTLEELAAGRRETLMEREDAERAKGGAYPTAAGMADLRLRFGLNYQAWAPGELDAIRNGPVHPSAPVTEAESQAPYSAKVEEPRPLKAGDFGAFYDVYADEYVTWAELERRKAANPSGYDQKAAEPLRDPPSGLHLKACTCIKCSPRPIGAHPVETCPCWTCATRRQALYGSRDVWR